MKYAPESVAPFEFEARLRQSPNLLLVLGDRGILDEDKELAENFFGDIQDASEFSAGSAVLASKTVYLCGDLATDLGVFGLDKAGRVFVVSELSSGYQAADWAWPVVSTGQVPIDLHGVGVLYRDFFPSDSKIFERVSSAHRFHPLTESSKPGTAYRTGTYLTHVEKDEEGRLTYKLLRCSTNIDGGTDNFKGVDWFIVNALNREAAHVFENHASLNHVLAQAYHNKARAETPGKQRKATIKMHSDKTKDMPEDGIMAFVTDYDNIGMLGHAKQGEPYHYEHKGLNKLTQLKFKLKKAVAGRPACDLVPEFSISLSPRSVVFIHLATNRWYTHEIKPSPLDASMLPTRMGYVVRCSKTDAVYDTDGQTYIKEGNKLRKMEDATVDDVQELRELYREENCSDDVIDYGTKFFSMNRGDYMAPGFETQTDEKGGLAHDNNMIRAS